MAALFLAWHSAFLPHGDGLQGSIISGRLEVAKMVVGEGEEEKNL